MPSICIPTGVKQYAIWSHRCSTTSTTCRPTTTATSSFVRHVRKNCSAFYADRLCLSPRYLSSVIRDVSGRTVVEWVNQAVILEAKVLLKHSDLLTYQIADELHFPNPSFFSKFFKRMTGMTPQEYQRT